MSLNGWRAQTASKNRRKRASLRSPFLRRWWIWQTRLRSFISLRPRTVQFLAHQRCRGRGPSTGFRFECSDILLPNEAGRTLPPEWDWWSLQRCHNIYGCVVCICVYVSSFSLSSFICQKRKKKNGPFLTNKTVGFVGVGLWWELD